MHGRLYFVSLPACMYVNNQVLFAAAFCTAGKAYAGGAASFLGNSKASTVTGTLFAASFAASKHLRFLYPA